MVEKRTCDYTGDDIEPGTGTMYVKVDGTVLHFKDSKAEKNYLLGREARDLEWTTEGRRQDERARQARERTAAAEAEEAAEAEAEEIEADEAEAEEAEAVEDEAEEEADADADEAEEEADVDADAAEEEAEEADAEEAK